MGPYTPYHEYEVHNNFTDTRQKNDHITTFYSFAPQTNRHAGVAGAKELPEQGPVRPRGAAHREADTPEHRPLAAAAAAGEIRHGRLGRIVAGRRHGARQQIAQPMHRVHAAVLRREQQSIVDGGGGVAVSAQRWPMV